jgi:hypothetical protein
LPIFEGIKMIPLQIIVPKPRVTGPTAPIAVEIDDFVSLIPGVSGLDRRVCPPVTPAGGVLLPAASNACVIMSS